MIGHKDTCKYGHLKLGDNLLLRPRVIKQKRSWLVKSGARHSATYEVEAIERVCVTCLNDQRKRYKEKIKRVVAEKEQANDE